MVRDDIIPPEIELQPDSIRLINRSNIPLVLSEDINQFPILNFKSKDKVFSSGNINMHICAEVAGGQSEKDIIEIFEDFSLKEDIYVIKNLSLYGDSKTYVVTRSIEYSLGFNDFKAISKRKANIIFPGKYILLSIFQIWIDFLIQRLYF